MTHSYFALCSSNAHTPHNLSPDFGILYLNSNNQEKLISNHLNKQELIRKLHFAIDKIFCFFTVIFHILINIILLLKYAHILIYQPDQFLLLIINNCYRILLKVQNDKSHILELKANFIYYTHIIFNFSERSAMICKTRSWLLIVSHVMLMS